MKTTLKNAAVLITLGVVALAGSYIMFISNLIVSIVLGVVKCAASSTTFMNVGIPIDLFTMQFLITTSQNILTVGGELALVGGIVLLMTIFIQTVFQPSAGTIKRLLEPRPEWKITP